MLTKPAKLKLVFIILILLPLKTLAQTPTKDDETSRKIEGLKSEIQEIKEQYEKKLQELNNRIEELETESKKEYEEPNKPLEEVKETPAKTYVIEWWKNTEAGYSGGFLLRTRDDLFSLKINLRSQFQFSAQDQEGKTDTSFDIRRLWIVFRGNAFRPWLKYLLILDASGNVELLDYTIDAAKIDQAVPRAGQYRVPFNREELTDPFNLQLVDNSILNREFTLGRDIGGSVGGVVSRFLTYSLGVFNGNGRNSANVDSSLLYVGRIMFTPTGEPRYSSIQPFPVSGDYTYTQGTFGNPQTPLIAISAALAYLPNFKPSNESPDNSVINGRVNALGSNEADIFQLSADIAIKYLIFSLEAEYDLRNINPHESNIESVLSQGFRIQSGVFLVPQIVEVAGRFVFIDLNNHSGNDKTWEITPGLNLYFTKNHNLKLQFDYSFIRDEFIGMDTNRFRTQFTVSF